MRKWISIVTRKLSMLLKIDDMDAFNRGKTFGSEGLLETAIQGTSSLEGGVPFVLGTGKVHARTMIREQVECS